LGITNEGIYFIKVQSNDFIEIIKLITY